MSTSQGQDPASVQPGLQSLEYINPKLGSLYFRFKEGEGLRYMTAEAFLAWKAMSSTQSADNRPFFVFLHDYGSSARIFDRVVSQIQFHCLAMDLRGWGRSDHTEDDAPRAYSVKRMKDEIPRIVDLLQGEKFILVGHGMGAKVAQLYATQQPPKNFLGLVLLAPAPLSSWRPSADIIWAYEKAYSTREDLEDFTRSILTESPIDENDFRNFVEDGMKDTPIAKDAWLSHGMGENLAHGLDRVGVAVVVRPGKEDKIISEEYVKREVSDKLSPTTPCFHLVASKRGHLIPLEDPHLAKILTRFTRDAALWEERRLENKEK